MFLGGCRFHFLEQNFVGKIPQSVGISVHDPSNLDPTIVEAVVTPSADWLSDGHGSRITKL